MMESYDNDDERVGLLRKLIVKYIQECYFSSAKFWLASCIEVMVRGNNTFFQSVIASTGLMPCLLYDIIYTQGDSLQILQLSFDILGELIKFNKANFLLLNYYFVDNNEFSTFAKKAISKEYLVDSNVFLRSILLSSDYFNKCDQKQGINESQYFSANCKFCRYLAESIYAIFFNLIQIIKPDDINQTNISCINTALLILILHYINGRLADLTSITTDRKIRLVFNILR